MSADCPFCPTPGLKRISSTFVPALVLFSCTSFFLPFSAIAGDPPPEGALEETPLAISAPLAAPPAALPAATDGKGRLISGAGVRLREKPSTSGKELTRLTMGTEVTELERSGREETLNGSSAPWIKVRTAEGKEGWIFGSFCRPFDSASREDLVRTLIAGRIGDENLAEGDARELFAWTEKLLAAKPAAALGVEYTLARLQALQKLLDAISRREKNRLDEAGMKKDPQLAKVADDIVFSEPAGSWLVKIDLFWAFHDANRSSPLADSIAWAAASQMLPGETEGYVPAVIDRDEKTFGRYLKAYPRGAHAAEAIKAIAETFNNLDASWDPKTADQEELTSVKRNVGEIRDAAKAAGTGGEDLLQAVETFEKRLK